jgi:hypothetical protein
MRHAATRTTGDRLSPSGRLRHCGRFAFWELPIGPWRCTRCDRRLAAGPMPKNAIARLLAELAELPPVPASAYEPFRQTIPRGHVLIVPAGSG